MSQINVPEAWKRLTKYFTLTPYLLPQQEAEQSIRDGLEFDSQAIQIADKK